MTLGGPVRRLLSISIVSLSLIALGCDGGAAPVDDDAALKAQVRAELEANNGKSDKGEDPCAEMGWYDDDLCDWFCPMPDSACGPCDGWSLVCEVDEIAVDTDGSGCADTCENNPDYRAPHQVEIGQLCDYEDDCVEGAYCVKQVGRCDDGEPGVCVEIPECPPMSEFYIEYVCACDGSFFANPEDAKCNGYNLRHAGLCEPDDEDADADAEPPADAAPEADADDDVPAEPAPEADAGDDMPAEADAQE